MYNHFCRVPFRSSLQSLPRHVLFPAQCDLRNILHNEHLKLFKGNNFPWPHQQVRRRPLLTAPIPTRKNAPVKSEHRGEIKNNKHLFTQEMQEALAKCTSKHIPGCWVQAFGQTSLVVPRGSTHPTRCDHFLASTKMPKTPHLDGTNQHCNMEVHKMAGKNLHKNNLVVGRQETMPTLCQVIQVHLSEPFIKASAKSEARSIEKNPDHEERQLTRSGISEWEGKGKGLQLIFLTSKKAGQTLGRFCAGMYTCSQELSKVNNLLVLQHCM